MKLLLKISLGILALILIIVLGFAFTFNPNDYKNEIITLFKDKTGRDLSIPGDISLSLFPWIGIDLGAIEISNAKGFGKHPFAKMSHLQVRAKFWPLFQQRLEADTIVIEGLKLNLSKNKNGISNWDDLIKNTNRTKLSSKTTPKTSTKTTSEKGSSKNILAAIALNGLEIRQAQFNWHDQQQKQKITIKDVQLSAGKLRPETKIPFNVEFHLQKKSLDARINFDSQIVFSSNVKQFFFYDTQLTSIMKLAPLKKPLAPQFNSELMKLDLEKQTFNSKKLLLSEGSLKLQAKIAVKKLLSNPYVNSHISIHSFNPRTLAENFAIQLPAIEDKNALTQLSAQLDVKGTLKNIELSNIKLTLDNTHISGNAKIKPAPASSSANLLVDNINFDRYLPKPVLAKPESKTSKNKSTNKNNEVALIPIALFSTINLDADLKIKKFRIKNTHWNNLHFATHAKNGRIQIKPLTMQGYDAKIQSDFTIKIVKNNALLSANLNIHNIKAGKLLSDLIGKDKLKGRTSITANFNTSGIKLSQLKQNLNGKFKLDLQNGTLKGFDLNHQQKVLKAKVKRQTIPAAPKPEETKIANLSASAIIKNGILNNKDLRASTPLSRIAGHGVVDIVKEQINYIASVKFTSSTDIKTDTPFEKMNAIPLDIHVRGTFDKPEIKVDFQKALGQLLKKELKKQERKIKEKVTKDLKKELEKKLGDKLKKLFKF